MQAGAAWPKLKPFVLELLTTLVGKQVRAGWRGRLLAWCVWQCMQRTPGMRGVSAISVHASRTLQRGNQALHNHNMPFYNASHNGQTRHEYCSEVHLSVLAIVQTLHSLHTIKSYVSR
jgi:hypothetical protein